MPLRSLLFPAVLALVLMATGCRADPCLHAVAEASGAGGPASFTASIRGESGAPGRRRSTVACADVLLLNAANYADTLAHARLDLRGGTLHLRELPAATADVIVQRKGYFPLKLTNVVLNPGPNPWEPTLLMYPTSTRIILPGELGVVLKPGASFSDIAHFVRHDGVRVQPAPGASYEIQLPWRGPETRIQMEVMCRHLVGSPFVEDARPLVNLSIVAPSL